MNLRFWQKSSKQTAADNTEKTTMPYAFNNRGGYSIAPDTFLMAFKEWTGACINIRAKALASLEWRYFVNGKEVERHWIKDLIEYPNYELKTKRNLFKLITKYRDITGGAYLWTKFNSKGLPAVLHVLPTNVVTPIYQDGVLVRYEVRDGGNHVMLPEEMIYLANYEPSTRLQNMFIGRSLVDAAIDSISASKELAEFVKRFFSNDGVPPLYLETTESWQPQQADLFKSSWNQQMPNHRLMGIINGKILPLTGSTGAGIATNMIGELDKMTKQNIAAVFGIPSGKITGENANFATAQVNDATFRIDTIEPLAYEIEEGLTAFFRRFEPTFELKHVEYVYSDPDQERADREHRIKCGLSSINDERGLMGLPNIEGGDSILIQSGLIPLTQLLNPVTPSIQVPTGNVAEPKQEPKKVYSGGVVKSFDTYNEIDKFFIWKSWDDIAQRSGNSYEKNWRALIDDIQKDVMSKLDTVTFKKLKKGEEININDLFNPKNWKNKLKKYFDAITTELIIENMKQAFTSIGQNWNGSTSQFDEAIKNAVNLSTDKIKVSVDTIDNEMKAKIQGVIKENLSPDEMKDAIRNTLKDAFAGWGNRAEMIATTTATFVRGESQNIAWKPMESKLKYYWLSMRDAKVRDSHRNMDGREPDENGMFNVNGDMMPYPAGGSNVKENVRCRCDKIAELIK